MTVYSLFLNSTLHMQDENIIFSGDTTKTLSNIADSVKEGQQILLDFSIDDLILFFSSAAKEWSKPDSLIQKNYAHHGLNFLIYWMREKNLRDVADISLRGNRHCLDTFTSLPYSSHQFIATPHGILCHWLAGNVPTLGMLSLLQGLLSKNVNILKVSKQNGHVIPNLIASLNAIECVNPDGKIIRGKDITKSIAVIYFESHDAELQKQLSRIANVRVAWGGKEAIESIMNTPKHYGTEDVIFGPKTSFMIIGKEMLQTEEMAIHIAKKASIDASVFEQRGCNSPHTVFVEKGSSVSPAQFAVMLSNEMNSTLKKYPKEPMQPSDTLKIASLRAKYDMVGDAYYPKGFEWSVLYSEEKGLATPCFNRTVFVRPIDDIFEAAHFCSHQTQSAGIALSPERKREVAKKLARKGIDRVPDVGGMTAHEVPWDGLFMMDRFVRWCKL